MTKYTVAQIADKANSHARELAQELLPNGHYNPNRTRWMFSGIADKGTSASAYVELVGAKQGKWFDYGNTAPGEEKGDMLDLLELKLGLADKRAAIEEAKQRFGMQDDWQPGKPAQLSPEERERRAAEARERAEAREAEAEAERAQRARGAKGLYLSGRLLAGTGAEAYLVGRDVDASLDPDADGSWPKSLKFHTEVWCTELARKVPAMLATMIGADGEQRGVHITYLQQCPQRGWCKADIAKPKIVRGACRGSFIPIAKGSSGKSMARMPEGEPVYVTEGIEDALVVRLMMPEARVIAAYSLGNIGHVLLPPAARHLVIVQDNDPDMNEQDKLERSIAQQQARGLEVQRVRPPAQFKDINEWWSWLKRQPEFAREHARAATAAGNRGVA